MNDIVDIEVFLDDVLPELPECPIPTAERRIREGLIEACEHGLWGHELEAFTVPEGATDYALAMPADDLLIHSVVSISSKQRLLQPGVDFDISDRGSLDFRTPRTATQALVPYELCVTLRPTREGRSVSQRIVDYHYETVVALALANAFRMSNRPWSDMAAYTTWRNIGEIALAEIRAEQERSGFTRSHEVTSTMERFHPQRGYAR